MRVNVGKQVTSLATVFETNCGEGETQVGETRFGETQFGDTQVGATQVGQTLEQQVTVVHATTDECVHNGGKDHKQICWFSVKYFSFLVSLDGTRLLKMDQEFFVGYRKTAIRPNEVLLYIDIPFTQEVLHLASLKSVCNFSYT